MNSNLLNSAWKIDQISHPVHVEGLPNKYINLQGLFNTKDIPLEEHKLYFLTHSWEDKEIYIFPKSIILKVNVIARLEFEIAYNNVKVHYYAMRTPLFH